MISARRIVTVFRTREGSGQFAGSAAEPWQAEWSLVRAGLQKESVVIARIRSADNWFGLTGAHMVCRKAAIVPGLPFGEIGWPIPPRYPRVKVEGGTLAGKLKDGRMLPLAAEPGRPFVGLWNAL